MMRSALACFALLAITFVSGNSPEASATAVDVRLRSTQPSYLLGEPVQLRVVATNVSKEPIECGNLHVDEATSQSEVFTFISYESGSFERYRDGIYGSGIQERFFTFLHPGESREYRSRLLYMSRHASRLAFERPGRYTVKVHYPLFAPRPGEERKPENFDGDSAGRVTRSNYERHPIESNTIQVTIKRPTGADAKVWEVLRQDPYLRFLQAGWYRQGEAEIPLALARLLRSNPKSGYAPTIRHALAIYYESHQAFDDLKQREQLREVLGIEPDVLFPGDRRLEREFELTLTEKTSIPDLVRKVSAVSGVPLDASPDLDRRSTMGKFGPMPLRTFLERLHSPIIAQYWERRGDGYFLQSEPPAEPVV